MAWDLFVIRLFGMAVTLLMAKWCGESLYVMGCKKSERLMAYVVTVISSYLFTFVTAILLMYLFTQAVSDFRSGLVDVKLNLQAGATMSACVLLFVPPITDVLWLIVTTVFLYFTKNIFSSGDRKGLFVCALWGMNFLNMGQGIFKSGFVISVPAVIGLGLSLFAAALYGFVSKRRYDVPMFPWMYLGFGITAGAVKILG